jgi:hypothetical protein
MVGTIVSGRQTALRTLNWSVDSKCTTFHSFFEGEMKNALIFEE